MKILLFGVLTDVIGQSVIETETMRDIDELKRVLITRFPLLTKYRFQFAVNKEKIEANISLNMDDEIALLPPFAGG